MAEYQKVFKWRIVLVADRQCPPVYCLTRIGDETSYHDDVMPTKFQVIEKVKFKYGCLIAKYDQAPKKARQNPPLTLPRTQALPSVLAWIGPSKFVDGLPMNRLAGIVEKRFSTPFISTTLADWMIKGAERIVSPLLKTMEKTLYGNDYLHIDETTLHTLNEDGWTSKHKSYIWYRATGGN